MRRLATVFGALLVLGGGVWILQGLDVAFAPRSFMTDNTQWVVYGGVAVLAGVGLVAFGLRAGR